MQSYYQIVAALMLGLSPDGAHVSNSRSHHTTKLSTPAVRLTCIARFSPISQPILNDFHEILQELTIFESRGDYRKFSSKKKYSLKVRPFDMQ